MAHWVLQPLNCSPQRGSARAHSGRAWSLGPALCCRSDQGSSGRRRGGGDPRACLPPRWPACRWAGRSTPSTRTWCSCGLSPRWSPFSTSPSAPAVRCASWWPPRPKSECPGQGVRLPSSQAGGGDGAQAPGSPWTRLLLQARGMTLLPRSLLRASFSARCVPSGGPALGDPAVSGWPHYSPSWSSVLEGGAGDRR